MSSMFRRDASGTAPCQDPYDFFLAHAGPDTQAALDLYELLVPHCHVFVDKRCLRSGDDWDKEIPWAQRVSRITVVLVSSRTEEAYYQREEVAAAIQMARGDKASHRVVPVYLDGCPQGDGIVPYGLRLKHGLSVPDEGGLERVAERLLAFLDRPPPDLPSPRTLFIGRTREVAELTERLRDSAVQLVTLHGPSGVGKTRLAIEVARNLQHDFADGIWFVELAPITEPGLVFLTIADRLRIRKGGDPALLLKEVLAQGRRLLLLDNFERVMPVARDVGDLLAACLSTKALVTSQEPLHIAIEAAVPVAPLTLPKPSQKWSTTELTQYEGVALFIERARQADPEFNMTDDNAHAIVSVCKYLEGLPVWLEPFAALTRYLTPQQIAERLAKRTWLIRDMMRDMPNRQKTPQAMLDWSQDLLDEAEQVLFRRLSVFVGGCVARRKATRGQWRGKSATGYACSVLPWVGGATDRLAGR